MALTPDDLRRLVDVLDAATADRGFDLRPTLVRIEETADDPDGFELGLLDLDGESVSYALLGTTATPNCSVLGSITGAWVAPEATFDGDASDRGRFSVLPSSHPDSVRARCFTLMARDGTLVGNVRLADGRVIDEAPPAGLAVDALRRAFGLPTPPATFPIGELLTSMWLSGIINEAAAARPRGRGLTMAAVARIHPALVLLEAGGRRVSAATLVEAAVALERVLSWADVRRMAQGGWFPTQVDQELAGWMDDGILARWLISSFPPVAELAEEACRVLRPPVAAAVRDALREMGGIRSSVA